MNKRETLQPHSVEAEEAVLGGLLINPGALYKVMGIICPADFFIVRHQWIYEAMTSLNKRGESVDYLLVTTELDQRGKLTEVGGAAYVLNLSNKTPSALNIEGYAETVARYAKRRKLITVAEQIARAAHSEETDIEVVQAKALKAVHEATRGMTGKNQVTGKDIAQRHLARTEKIIKGGLAAVGLSTSIPDLDAVIGGMQQGMYITIAARPGLGKSSWMQQAALNLARNDIPVGFMSLEMGEYQLNDRLVARLGRIPLPHVTQARYSHPQWDRYVELIAQIENMPLRIDYTARVTPNIMRSVITEWVYEHGVQAVFIDYVQLMDGDDSRGQNRTAIMGQITREIKLTARELNIPVVAAAQLSRKVEERNDKRPYLSDLRESGSIEQDSDVVIFLYRESYYDESKDNHVEIIVSKNRNGPTGTVHAWWEGEILRFGPAQVEHVELNAV